MGRGADEHGCAHLAWYEEVCYDDKRRTKDPTFIFFLSFLHVLRSYMSVAI